MICPQEQLITLGTLDLAFLRVDEHVLLEVLPPHEQLVTVVTLEVLLPGVDDHVGFQVSLLGERLVTQSTPVVLLTCVYLEVGPQVAGITESLATEIALVGLHTHMTHKVDVKFGRRDKSLGAHGALPLPLFAMAWPVAAAVAMARKMVMDVAAQVGFELSIGTALLATVTEMYIWVFRNTNLLSIIPTVIKKQFIFRRDILGGTEVDFSIMGISHQILFFPIPGFAHKHHPITFIFVSCNDAEF